MRRMVTIALSLLALEGAAHAADLPPQDLGFRPSTRR
jgi:hypothetical protein